MVVKGLNIEFCLVQTKTSTRTKGLKKGLNRILFGSNKDVHTHKGFKKGVKHKILFGSNKDVHTHKRFKTNRCF